MPHCFTVAEAADRLAVHLDVGDDIDFRHAFDETTTVLLDRREVEIAESAAEGDQVVVGEGLVAEQHNGIAVPGFRHAGETDVVEGSQIARLDLNAEHRAGRDRFERGGGIAGDGCGLHIQGHGCLVWRQGMGAR